MKPQLSTLLVALRLFLVWWLGLGILFGLTAGAGGGFCLAPVVAFGMALAGANLHHRGGAFGAFRRATIQVPQGWEALEGELAALLQEDLAATSFSLAGTRIHAAFQPPAWSGAWRRWRHSDELIVDAASSEPSGGSTLQVWARPLGGLGELFYRFLWVDGGRNQRRMRAFQERLSARLAEGRRRQEAAWKAGSLEARLAQAELLLLRAQVEPHFLFNTLAHLRELVRASDTGTALRMLDHLIAHARSVSERIRQSTHPLERELDAVRNYLSLMQLRFGDRLRFGIEADPACLGTEVPVGALLIPTENAVKHGVEPSREGGSVAVRCRREGEILALEVLDDGPGLSPEPGAGMGLSNLRERLRLLFGEAARLRVENREGGGVRVVVTLPIA